MAEGSSSAAPVIIPSPIARTSARFCRGFAGGCGRVSMSMKERGISDMSVDVLRKIEDGGVISPERLVSKDGAHGGPRGVFCCAAGCAPTSITNRDEACSFEHTEVKDYLSCIPFG